MPCPMCRAPVRANLDSEMAEASPQRMSLKMSDLVPEAPEAAQRILKGNCHPWQVRAAGRTCVAVHVDSQDLMSGAKKLSGRAVKVCVYKRGVAELLVAPYSQQQEARTALSLRGTAITLSAWCEPEAAPLCSQALSRQKLPVAGLLQQM